MISLFETGVTEPRMPPGMVTELVSRGSGSVANLEFFNLDDPAPAAPQALADDGRQREAEERARQVAVMIDAAREEATAETRAEMERDFAAELLGERLRIERLAAEFARDRQRYFAAAEVQVVRLALAVARRVLAREVEGHALPLEHCVRAALAAVQDGSATTLRVPPAETAAWQQMFAAESRVTVEAEVRMAAGGCVLETRVGRVELDLETQMAEVERGFAELTGFMEPAAHGVAAEQGEA